MKLEGPYSFSVEYTDTSFTVRCELNRPRFSRPASEKGPKLYVFSRDGLPIYVGATVRPMGARMRTGWQAKGKGGYYGYRFRSEGSKVDLDIWLDVEPVTERPASMRSGSDIETLEAELVYLLRYRTGQWPAYQTEIHFYPSNNEHRSWAESVLAHYPRVAGR